MSSFFEEQSEEIEVLMSIFPTEFELIAHEPLKSFKIHLAPGADEVHVAVALVCVFPSEYPSCSPTIEIEVEKGLGKKQVDELSILVRKVAEENIGAASVFTITEAVKDWLLDNNVAGQDGSMYAEMMRRMQQKDVEVKKKAAKAAIIEAAESESKEKVEDPAELERIRKRQAGTVVTIETFNEWKARFEAEQRALADVGGKGDVRDIEDRLSGKQLFLQNKAGQEDEEALIVAGEAEADVIGVVDEIGELDGKLKSSGLDRDGDMDEDDDDEDYVDDDEGFVGADEFIEEADKEAVQQCKQEKSP